MGRSGGGGGVAFHYRSAGPKLRRRGAIKGPSALVAGGEIPENREIAGIGGLRVFAVGKRPVEIDCAPFVGRFIRVCERKGEEAAGRDSEKGVGAVDVTDCLLSQKLPVA